MKYADIKVNDTFEVKKKITSNNIETFAEITGDKNPVHLDEEFAKNTMFGGRIAHGIYGVGLISAVIGMDFPGPGTIYMKQDSKFLKPIYIGEEVTVKVTVIEKIEAKSRLVLRTEVIKEDGKPAIDGEALVLYKGE